VTTRTKHRAADGRFVTGDDLHSRYAAIAEVLRAADSERPEDVSMRTFDAARKVAGHGSLPLAQNLADWLGLSWAEVKTVALDKQRDKTKTYRVRRKAPDRPWKSEEGALLALRRVAEARESVELSQVDYDVYRKQQSQEVRDLLPTSPQVIALFGSWAKALARVGLRTPTAARAKGMPVVEAIGLFVSTQGRLPRRADLVQFAADERWHFELESLSRRPWDEWITDFREYWGDQLKRWVPPQPRRGGERPPLEALSAEEIAKLPRPQRLPKNYWTYDRVIECVIRYFEDHPEEPMLQQGPYREWAKLRNAEGLWTAQTSTLQRHGTLVELSLEARRRRTVLASLEESGAIVESVKFKGPQGPSARW